MDAAHTACSVASVGDWRGCGSIGAGVSCGLLSSSRTSRLSLIAVRDRVIIWAGGVRIESAFVVAQPVAVVLGINVIEQIFQTFLDAATCELPCAARLGAPDLYPCAHLLLVGQDYATVGDMRVKPAAPCLARECRRALAARKRTSEGSQTGPRTVPELLLLLCRAPPGRQSSLRVLVLLVRTASVRS